MKIINTEHDIDILRHTYTVPKEFLRQVEDYFRQLQLELCGDQESMFSLEDHGPIVLLEVGDDLKTLGYPSGDLNLLLIEYVEFYELHEFQYYKITVLNDNDWITTFFTLMGTHNDEIEQWLKEQSEY